MDAKNYLVDVDSVHENSDHPLCARFAINEAYAREIIRLCSIVKANGLFKVEIFNNPVITFINDPQVEDSVAETEGVSLNVSATNFWFMGVPMEGDQDFFSSSQPIDELAEHFGIPFDVAPTPATPAETTSHAQFVEGVARLSIWDYVQENGQPYTELEEEPGDGYLDSHTCLMNLIESARKIDNGAKP